MASSKESLPKENDQSSAPDSNAKDSFWTPGRIAITLVAVALIVWYWSSKGVQNATVNSNIVTRTASSNSTTAPAAFVAIPAEIRDATLRTLDGDSLKLSDFADKVLIVNIWAVWCGPCRLEMPELVKISNEYKSRGLVVLGLATSYNEDKPQVKEYVQSKNIPYQVVFDDGTLEGPLVQLVHAQSVIPQSFLISRDGKIVKHFQGFNPYSTPQNMRQAIEDALND